MNLGNLIEFQKIQSQKYLNLRLAALNVLIYINLNDSMNELFNDILHYLI